jgi:zinc transporter ZupT
MVDWTVLSPAFLTLVVEWVGAVVAVYATGLAQPTKNS